MSAMDDALDRVNRGVEFAPTGDRKGFLVPDLDKDPSVTRPRFRDLVFLISSMSKFSIASQSIDPGLIFGSPDLEVEIYAVLPSLLAL